MEIPSKQGLANQFVASLEMYRVTCACKRRQQATFELKEMFEQELEGTKLELHRLQGGKRLRRAYYAQEDPEARFIDKEK